MYSLFGRFLQGFGIHHCHAAGAAVVYTKTLRETTRQPLHQSSQAAKNTLWPGLSYKSIGVYIPSPYKQPLSNKPSTIGRKQRPR